MATIYCVHTMHKIPYWVLYIHHLIWTLSQAETPVLWPPDAKSWLIGKDSDAGRDWGQEGKGTTENEMAGWHHWLDGHEFEWTPGVGDGQGGLACCDSWGRKESVMTERLDWTELKYIIDFKLESFIWFYILPFPSASHERFWISLNFVRKPAF